MAIAAFRLAQLRDLGLAMPETSPCQQSGAALAGGRIRRVGRVEAPPKPVPLLSGRPMRIIRLGRGPASHGRQQKQDRHGAHGRHLRPESGRRPALEGRCEKLTLLLPGCNIIRSTGYILTAASRRACAIR